MKPICQGCKKTPEELEEYSDIMEQGDPDDYVRKYEGTYNPVNGHFLCTSCYIKAGMPSVPYPGRWVCP